MGWYSNDQQYSPNMIQYKSLVKSTAYAICHINDDVQLLFSQKKGSKTRVRVHVANGPPSADLVFRINSLGRCDMESSEFNPLKEIDNKGRANPF